ncbi:surface-adhesin E family protein [Methylocystis sp. S23]|jgi:hypothetical protein
MRKNVLLFVLTFAVCAPDMAQADWQLVSQEGFSTTYVDPASRKALPESVVSIRALTDYDPASPEAASFKLSEKGLSEVEKVLLDCGKNAYRSEGGDWFEAPMGAGAIRSAYPPKTAWSPVPSFYAGLYSVVCVE